MGLSAPKTCNRCGRDPQSQQDMQECCHCPSYRRKQRREQRQQKQATGDWCVTCVTYPPIEGSSKCAKCADKAKVRAQTKKETGGCVACPNQAIPGKTRCEACSQKIKNRKKEKYDGGHCIQCGIRPYLPEKKLCLECLVEGRYTATKVGRQKIGYEFPLSREDYYRIIGQPCHYCEFPLEDVYEGGLDRIDNSQDYHKDNLVPACGLCNMARNDFFTVADFKQFVGPGIRQWRIAQGHTRAICRKLNH